MKKTKVFSNVDAKDGFLQVALSELSLYLIICWTPLKEYSFECHLKSAQPMMNGSIYLTSALKASMIFR